jgi:hypothetical protein
LHEHILSRALECARYRCHNGSTYQATQNCNRRESLSWSVTGCSFCEYGAKVSAHPFADCSEGKSSLTVQYCEGHFVESYYPTIENTFSHEILYKNQKFATEIIDTAGQVRYWMNVEDEALTSMQDEYSILNSKHFIGIHGYMIVYSVGSRPSFEMVRNIRVKILNHLVSMGAIVYPRLQTNSPC